MWKFVGREGSKKVDEDQSTWNKVVAKNSYILNIKIDLVYKIFELKCKIHIDGSF